MDDEKLILLVQANECLYNKYCPGYKNLEKKRNIWNQISAQMEHPEEVCQKRWSSLRDRYTKEKRQENLPSGSGAKYTSPWVLMQAMDFIAPHIVPRPMRSSCNILHNKDKYEYNYNSQSPLSPTSSLSALCAQSPTVASPPLLSPLSAQSPTVASTQLPEMPSEEALFEPIRAPSATPVMPKRKRPAEIEDKSFSQAADAFKKLCESKINSAEENDALSGFGKMIVGTIRTMSQSQQIIAMQKVTSLVMKMKLEEDSSQGYYVVESDIE